MYLEKYTIWHIRKGSIDILIITVAITILLFIPLFQFFIKVLTTIDTIDKTKEILEIASMSTFTELNRDCLGNGILEIEESSAIAVFNRQITELTLGNMALHSMQNVSVEIYWGNGLVKIDSRASVLSSFKKFVQVEHSLGFVIDPIMEGT